MSTAPSSNSWASAALSRITNAILEQPLELLRGAASASHMEANIVLTEIAVCSTNVVFRRARERA
jgi:hypothetical protein